VGIDFGGIEATRQTVTLVTRFAFTLELARTGLTTQTIGRAWERRLLAHINFRAGAAITLPTVLTRALSSGRTGRRAVGLSVTRILNVAEIDLHAVSFTAITIVTGQTFTFVFARTGGLTGGLNITRTNFTAVNRVAAAAIALIASLAGTLVGTRAGLLTVGERGARRFGGFTVINFNDFDGR
jgi:hypothetical protein